MRCTYSISITCKLSLCCTLNLCSHPDQFEFSVLEYFNTQRVVPFHFDDTT